MSSGTVLEPAGSALEPVVGRLWQLFSHDLSEFRDRPPDPDGSYPEHRLPEYWSGDPARRAYLVRHDGALAGFALVAVDRDGLQHVDAFFVVRPLRRRGVGHRAARLLLGGATGRWQIGFQDENPRAARFWRQVAEDLARARPGMRQREETRAVPDKPWLPLDRLLLLDLDPAAPGAG